MTLLLSLAFLRRCFTPSLFLLPSLSLPLLQQSHTHMQAHTYAHICSSSNTSPPTQFYILDAHLLKYWYFSKSESPVASIFLYYDGNPLYSCFQFHPVCVHTALFMYASPEVHLAFPTCWLLCIAQPYPRMHKHLCGV